MNLLRLIKKNGFFYLVEQVFNRVVPASIVRFSVMNIYDVNREKLRQLKRNDQIVCQLATDDPSLTAVLREVTYMGMAAERIVGHTGYLASIRDTNAIDKPAIHETAIHETAFDELAPVGGLWAGIGGYSEEDLGFELELTKNQAWIYCALVNKAARGAGVYANSFCFAVDDLADRGLDDVLLSVAVWNKKSLRAHERLVNRRIGRITAIRVFAFAFVFASGALAKSKTFTANSNSDPIVIKLKPTSQ